MSSEVIIAGAISTFGGGLFGFLRHRQQMRRDVEIARIGKEQAESDLARCSSLLDEAKADLDQIRADRDSARREVDELRSKLAELTQAR